jgi:hypothetical protein
LGCLIVQLSGGIGNVTTNTGLVEMAMAYSRSRILCAAARLGIADALGDEIRSVGFLAEICQADADALYRLLRALASIGVTGGDNARTLSADSVWQTVAEECASVRVASRHLLVGSTRR